MLEPKAMQILRTHQSSLKLNLAALEEVHSVTVIIKFTICQIAIRQKCEDDVMQHIGTLKNRQK